MNDEARLLYLTWHSIMEFIPQNLRDDAAENFLKAYLEVTTLEIADIDDVLGECDHIDNAIEIFNEENENPYEDSEHDY